MKDKEGNQIKYENKVISLKLAKGGRWRTIGRVDEKTKTIYMERVRHAHMLNVNRTYGFNHYVLSKGHTFDKVHLKDDHGEYLIPVKEILTKGKFLKFSGKGFELQIFYPIDEIEKHKINDTF